MTNKNAFCVTIRKRTDAEIIGKFDIFSETKKVSRVPILLLKKQKPIILSSQFMQVLRKKIPHCVAIRNKLTIVSHLSGNFYTSKNEQ